MSTSPAGPSRRRTGSSRLRAGWSRDGCGAAGPRRPSAVHPARRGQGDRRADGRRLPTHSRQAPAATLWDGALQLNIGVTVFFVLSGFLLYRPFLAARMAGTPGGRACGAT